LVLAAAHDDASDLDQWRRPQRFHSAIDAAIPSPERRFVEHQVPGTIWFYSHGGGSFVY
jgi:hypothetical protein